MYSQQVGTSQGEMKYNTLPNLGNHLILEFINTEVDLNNYELLNKLLTAVLNKTSVTVESSQHKIFQP